MRTIRFRTTQYLTAEYVVQLADDEDDPTEGDLICDLDDWTDRAVDFDILETSEEFVTKSLKRGDVDPRRRKEQRARRARKATGDV